MNSILMKNKIKECVQKYLIRDKHQMHANARLLMRVETKESKVWGKSIKISK